jgi:hypothetical protein
MKKQFKLLKILLEQETIDALYSSYNDFGTIKYDSHVNNNQYRINDRVWVQYSIDMFRIHMRYSYKSRVTFIFKDDGYHIEFNTVGIRGIDSSFVLPIDSTEESLFQHSLVSEKLIELEDFELLTEIRKIYLES